MEIFVPAEWSYVFEMAWKEDPTKVIRMDIPEDYALRIIAIIDELAAEQRETWRDDLPTE